jgi:predicted RNA methylase
VLADYLLRITPPVDWEGAKVLELGCGVGQLGIPLAMSGAAVIMTDLEHIVPLTQQNVDVNAHGMAVKPRVMPLMWGTNTEVRPAAIHYSE